MSDSPDYPSYAGYATPSGADRRPPPLARIDPRANRLRRLLWTLVAVLGLATFAVNVDSPVLPGFAVHLPVFAAIVAAVAILPRQDGRGWVVVALAAAGFLDALDGWIMADAPRWTVMVITVLNALQSVAALVAMLLENKFADLTRPVDPTSDYSAYAGFALAYQAYAAHYQQTMAPQQSAGQAAATAYASGTNAETAQEALAKLQAKYHQNGVSLSTAQAGRSGQGRPAAPLTDPGMPGVNSGPPPTARYGRQDHPGGSGSGLPGY